MCACAAERTWLLYLMYEGQRLSKECKIMRPPPARAHGCAHARGGTYFFAKSNHIIPVLGNSFFVLGIYGVHVSSKILLFQCLEIYIFNRLTSFRHHYACEPAQNWLHCSMALGCCICVGAMESGQVCRAIAF